MKPEAQGIIFDKAHEISDIGSAIGDFLLQRFGTQIRQYDRIVEKNRRRQDAGLDPLALPPLDDRVPLANRVKRRLVPGKELPVNYDEAAVVADALAYSVRQRKIQRHEAARPQYIRGMIRGTGSVHKPDMQQYDALSRRHARLCQSIRGVIPKKEPLK